MAGSGHQLEPADRTENPSIQSLLKIHYSDQAKNNIPPPYSCK